jgi:SAM-dependent methyltransferase
MINSYYDQLTPYYKFMLQDWNASLYRQADVLDIIIREYFGTQAHRILDAACGIGTQSIGLAQLGYQVTASDISAAEIDQAKKEAAQRGLQLTFCLADMRQLTQCFSSPFDVVIACDNAIPHLLSDREILQAFQQFYQCTTTNGGCIISVRDYASMERSGKKIQPRQVHHTPDGHILLFDLWEFDEDGRYYDFTTYIVEDNGQPQASTHVIRGGRYYCVSLETLEALLKQADFKDIVVLKEGFYQPLIIGRKYQPIAPLVFSAINQRSDT